MAAASSSQGAPGARPRPSRGVILAGGKGLRANPTSAIRNKCLFPVHDRSLLEGQIEIARDQLGLSEILIIVGHLKDQIREAFGDGARLGVRLQYPEVEAIEEGPAKGLLKAREFLGEPFFLFLGDEFHLAPRHEKMLAYLDRAPDALFTYARVRDPRQILSNFSIEVGEGDRLLRVVEKPQKIVNDLCGCGTLYLTPGILDAIAAAPPSPRTGRVELYEVAASFIGRGNVFAVDLEDPGYVNINTLADLERARFNYRSHHFAEFKTSVVIPSWNEAESIGAVVADFRARPEVHEILVVDNDSQDGTAEIARGLGARILPGRKEGYGAAIHAGLGAAEGDILVVCEADFTFRAADLPKLLEYLKDADAVIGTRTCRAMLARGAEMKPAHRLANVALAKAIELLWPHLPLRYTDVGCSYRAIWKQVWREIEPSMTGIGPEFAPEMAVELARARRKTIEAPISYHPRLGGASKHGPHLAGLAKTGMRMARLLLGKWVKDVLAAMQAKAGGK